MGIDVQSGHGTPDFYGQYDDVHVKITIVCAITEGRVSEYWWDVTPSGAQLKRSKKPGKHTKGKILWELMAYDVRTGDQLNCAIDSLKMSTDSGWKRKWGKPRKNPQHSNNRHWRMDVQVPGGTTLERFAYNVRLTVAGTSITIDPEVDFEPGE